MKFTFEDTSFDYSSTVESRSFQSKLWFIIADYLNDEDVPDDDDDGYDEEDENIIRLDDIAYSLTFRGGTQMIINDMILRTRWLFAVFTKQDIEE